MHHPASSILSNIELSESELGKENKNNNNFTNASTTQLRAPHARQRQPNETLGIESADRNQRKRKASRLQRLRGMLKLRASAVGAPEAHRRTPQQVGFKASHLSLGS